MNERIVLNLLLPITVQIIPIDTDPGNSSNVQLLWTLLQVKLVYVNYIADSTHHRTFLFSHHRTMGNLIFENSWKMDLSYSQNHIF